MNFVQPLYFLSLSQYIDFVLLDLGDFCVHFRTKILNLLWPKVYFYTKEKNFVFFFNCKSLFFFVVCFAVESFFLYNSNTFNEEILKLGFTLFKQVVRVLEMVSIVFANVFRKLFNFHISWCSADGPKSNFEINFFLIVKTRNFSWIFFIFSIQKVSI